MGFMSGIFTLAPLPLQQLPDWGWLGAILNFINGSIGNAAWTMVIFTILLKLCTFPLDYFSRYKMKKNAVIMEEMKPQLEKLEKQCKGDKQLYNQRMLPLLKKEGYSLGGACLPTLLTLVLFIFIFQGLNSYATFRNADTFNELVKEYNVLAKEYDTDIEEEKAALDKKLVEKYKQLNPSWLWVKNPWRPDVNHAEGFFSFVAGVNPVATYDEFTNTNGKTNYGLGGITLNAPDDVIARGDYNTVMDAIRASEGSGNGYYILIVLAVGISFLSQYIIQKTQGAAQQSSANGMNTNMMKYMIVLFPIMLGFFAFSYSAVFTLYIITNSTLSLLATLIINVVVENNMKKIKAQKLAQIKYRR